MKELNSKSNISLYLMVFLLSLFILVIEGSFLSVFFNRTNMPDLLLIMVTCLAFLWGERKGVGLGLLTGLLQDLFFGPALGFFALAKMVVAYLVGLTAREVYKDQLAGPMLVVFMATFMHEFIIFFLRLLFWGSGGDFFYLLDEFFLPKAVYHLLLAIPFYPLLYRANQRGFFYIFQK
ncbi:MAG: rod shape-determining protein MreD [Bacillota bacterium]